MKLRQLAPAQEPQQQLLLAFPGNHHGSITPQLIANVLWACGFQDHKLAAEQVQWLLKAFVDEPFLNGPKDE